MVEDQEPVRKAMRRILERSGYDVLESGSVAEAVELVDVPDLSVELLLTDLGLELGPREHFMEKPFDLEQLARKVRVALEGGHTPV